MQHKVSVSILTLVAVFFLACSLTRCGSSGPTYSAGINGMKF